MHLFVYRLSILALGTIDYYKESCFCVSVPEGVAVLLLRCTCIENIASLLKTCICLRFIPAVISNVIFCRKRAQKIEDSYEDCKKNAQGYQVKFIECTIMRASLTAYSILLSYMFFSLWRVSSLYYTCRYLVFTSFRHVNKF